MNDKAEVRIQGQLLLITVGIAFIIAIIFSGVGLGVIFWKLDRMETAIRSGFAYEQDMAEIRHREIEELIRGAR